jgi:AcrR family transcriptional regulator
MEDEKKAPGDPEVRERIVAAAARLFHSRGYNATGINELIAEANVAKRSLYKHFDSKTAILKAYLQAFQENLYKDVSEYVQKFTDPKDKLLALFDYRIKNQERNDFLGCPFVKVNAEIGFDDQEINQLTQDHQNKLRNFIRKLVAAANDRQILDNQAFSDLIFLLMEGGLLSATIYKSTAELKKAKALVHGLLLGK